MTYAFTFDASACSGCKACQEACKDKKKLSTGLLLRRVIEVSGGEWQRTGEAWENSVFAYNLSLACNHCTHPKCAGVCPVDAYTVRPDGIVLIDQSKCMGCDYCAWACPYGAPQYDVKHGIMTKCDFCFDRLDAGMPPTCVAACPLRVLNYETIGEPGSKDHWQDLWQLPGTEHPFPLPTYSRTEPHLAIRPHRGMNSTLAKAVANQEELHPPGSVERLHRTPAFRELPLVGFTLLTQAAAGMAVFSLLLPSMPLPLLLAIGILLAVAGLISFLHLGRKHNAWRSMVHIEKSWLSREILAAGMFGVTWGIMLAQHLLWRTAPSLWLMAILGATLVYCTARVYYLRSVPAWNSWRTLAAFSLSAIILGSLGMLLTVSRTASLIAAGLGTPGLLLISSYTVWLIIAGLGMLAEIGLILAGKPAGMAKAVLLRLGLLGSGVVGALLVALTPTPLRVWLVIFTLLAAAAAEAIGRWQFYASRVPFPAPSSQGES